MLQPLFLAATLIPIGQSAPPPQAGKACLVKGLFLRNAAPSRLLRDGWLHSSGGQKVWDPFDPERKSISVDALRIRQLVFGEGHDVAFIRDIGGNFYRWSLSP